MAKNVSKKDPQSYSDLIDQPTSDLINKVKSHEIDVLPKERTDFLKFAGMNQTQRKAYVESLKPSTSEATTPQPPPAPGPPPGELPAAKKPVTSDIPGTPPPPPTPGTPPGEVDPRVSIDKLQEQINKQRAKAGSLGQENKTLKQLLEDREKQIEDLKKSIPPPLPVEMPTLPLQPDPNKFTEGYYDDAFKAEQTEYEKRMVKYNTDLQAYVNSAKPKWAEELSKEFETVKSKAESAHQFVETSTRVAVEDGKTQAMNSMWNEIKELQTATGLKTTVPIDIINKNQLIVNSAKATNPDGTPFFTAAEIDAADQVIKSMPKPEYENYQKIVRIGMNLYGFDDQGVPSSAFEGLDRDLAWQAAVRRAGVTGVTAIIPKPPTQNELTDRLAQQQQNQSAAPNTMNGSELGSGEPPLNDATTKEEKQTKLLEMVRRLNQNQSLLRDKGFVENLEKARSELGMARR